MNMNASIIETVERFELSHQGRDRPHSISVYRPSHVDEDVKLPIVFVTDADMVFGTAAELMGVQSISQVLKPALIVGIGYGTDVVTTSSLRFKDLTTPITVEAREDLPLLDAAIGDETGGADGLLDFIVDVLTPEIVRRYPSADPDRRNLFGHSLGGLFTAHALLTRPGAFEGYIIGSPSLFWNRFAVLEHVDAFAKALPNLRNKPRVFIGVGGTEEDVPKEAPAGFAITVEQLQHTLSYVRVIAAAREFADSLKRGLPDVEFRVFEGEGHQQVVPYVLNSGLRHVLK